MIDNQQVHIAEQEEQIELLRNELNAVKNMLQDILSEE